MRRLLKRIIAIAIVILFASLLAWALREKRQRSTPLDETERPASVASQVSGQTGQTFIKLDASTQARIGLKVAELQATTRRQEISATAVVLSAQELTTMRKGFLVSATELEKSRVASNVSKQEYDRLKILYQQDQNVSAKAVQAAEAAWRTDEATLRGLRDTLALDEDTARQSWGNVIARWLVNGSPGLDRILEQEDVLLQISVPQASGATASGSAYIKTLKGETQTAMLLSAFPKIDPRIQTASFLYVTKARSDVVPGMTLTTLLPSGPAIRGVIVPGTATVWWQGKAWAYVQNAPGKFLRREVPTQMPVEIGWFVGEGFSPGDKIVVTGAQQLLSQEFRAETHVVGDEDEEK